MKDFPKISIVTPSFNQANFLEQTIDSVLSQKYPNLEYFVIDGGSTDGSVEIIKKYSPFLSGWVSEKDKGQSHAINKGLKLITGDIFNWLNSDDYYSKNSLFTVAEHFTDPSVHVLCGRSRLFGEGLTDRISSGTDIYPDNLAKTIGKARIDQPETFFRTHLIKQLGTVNENLHYLMDRDLWIRYLLAFGLDGIVKTPDVLVNFRLHPDSKTVSQAAKFEKERDQLYYTLSKHFNTSLEIKHFENQFEKFQSLNITWPQISDNQVVSNAIQHFFILKSDELYFERKFVEAKKMLDFEFNSSVKTDEVYLKLKNRLNLPLPLLKLILHLRQSFNS